MKSKLKVESPGVLVFSVFYAVAGATLVFISVIYKFTAPPPIGVLGLLSLITAYGVFRMRKWSVLLVTALFFLGITFSASILYYLIVWQTFEEALLFYVTLIAYLIMTVVAFLYVVAKREIFR